MKINEVLEKLNNGEDFILEREEKTYKLILKASYTEYGYWGVTVFLNSEDSSPLFQTSFRGYMRFSVLEYICSHIDFSQADDYHPNWEKLVNAIRKREKFSHGNHRFFYDAGRFSEQWVQESNGVYHRYPTNGELELLRFCLLFLDTFEFEGK